MAWLACTSCMATIYSARKVAPALCSYSGPLGRCLRGQHGALASVHHRWCSIRHHATETTSSEQLQQVSPVRDVYGSMRQVKTSPMKLNLVAKLIRGMSITNAIIQMEVSEKKAAKFVLTTLLDTQRRAANNHDIAPQNLYVVESFAGKGAYLKRIRYHGRGMHGIMHKSYSHYFLKLREGAPPPKRKRKKEDHKSFKTSKLIAAGPRSIPNAL